METVLIPLADMNLLQLALLFICCTGKDEDAQNAILEEVSRRNYEEEFDKVFWQVIRTM